MRAYARYWAKRLVLQLHIQCIFRTCPSDVRSAARTWVDAIDDEASARL